MTITKTCSKCGEEKLVSDFNKRANSKDGLSSWCKMCCHAWATEYYQKNKKKISEKHAKYHLENHEKVRAHQREYYYSENGQRRAKEYRRTHREQQRKNEKEWRDKNREHYREMQRKHYLHNKDRHKEWHKKWRDSHKDQIKASSLRYRQENKEKMNKAHVERLHKDPLYNMKERTRNMIRWALRVNGHNKTSHTAEIVGCNLDVLCAHLLSTWDKNYGKPWNGEPYHIDHITPLATANTKDDIIRLCHYTNLQMLTPEDNMAKSDKI